MTAKLPPYPDFPCSNAPLRPGSAPKDGCDCKVCAALRKNAEKPRG